MSSSWNLIHFRLVAPVQQIKQSRNKVNLEWYTTCIYHSQINVRKSGKNVNRINYNDQYTSLNISRIRGRKYNYKDEKSFLEISKRFSSTAKGLDDKSDNNNLDDNQNDGTGNSSTKIKTNYYDLGLAAAADSEEVRRYITMKQEEAAKKERDKTTENVQRALYGNIIICLAKFGAWMSSGSSAMLSEFVHSVVDCGNQSLLLIGLRDSAYVADRKHPYGYGKSIYFWALISALGTFWLGAGVSMRHALEELFHPSLDVITWQVWGVLGASLAIDGYVLMKTIHSVLINVPENSTFWKHVWRIRDPATIAVLLEDGAACLGVVIASTGIILTHYTGNPIYDGLAGVGISGLLATMGLILVRLNRRFLLGQAVDNDIIKGIEEILNKHRSIDLVHSVQSQWTGPNTFSYKASVDFDGTYLAARLMSRYQNEFFKIKDTLEDDLPLLLSWYAEDVVRTVEREVRLIEAEIRETYPGATYIELEPDSKFAHKYAVDDNMEAKLKRIEMEALSKYLKTLYVVDSTSKYLKDARNNEMKNQDEKKDDSSKDDRKSTK